MRFSELRPDEMNPAGLDPVDPEAMSAAAAIVADVRGRGWPALVEYAERFGDRTPGEPLVLERPALLAGLDRFPAADRRLLERAAERIRRFAQAQRAALGDVELAVADGTVGHRVAPVARAGCYAPGGRFPLPSSVLMTAVTARAAGVPEVWVASPRPALATIAAAALADADALLAVGGAQAIAAFAYGAGPVPAVDVVVGPGNRFVTAAKQIVAGRVGIDMLAGPSEVLIIADEQADPAVVAADLLAQCEHDVAARGLLVTPSRQLASAVVEALRRQLETLPTRATAEPALARGGFVVVADLDEACEVSDRVAPEHLELLVSDPESLLSKLSHFGAVFLGAGSAEVFGDYGVGPNHTLPTGGTARSTGGLSVFHFLRVRTHMRLAPTPELVSDTAAFARLEGLEGHARAAELRRESKK